MASKYAKFITRSYNGKNWSNECIFCGHVWAPSVQTSGRMPRGAYVCPEGCADNYDEAYKRYRKMLFRFDPVTGKKVPYKQTVEVEE